MYCQPINRSAACVAALFLALSPLSPWGGVPSVAAASKKPDTHLRVNCGGGTIKNPATGEVWLSDKDYVVRGKKYRFPQSLKIAVTPGNPPESVYSTVRRGSVVYRFKKLPNGRYKVRLHFVDGKQLAVRSMNFWIEGSPLVQNLNIREAAGGVAKSFVYEAVVEVTDGNGLDLRGTRGHGDDVFLSAIEILPASPDTPLSRPVEASPSTPKDLAKQLRDFAEGPVKVVWARTDEEEDFYLKGNHGILMGFDSENGGEERVILSELRSYATPMITPDGKQIVFTDQVKQKCYVVGFDGRDLREFTSGYASDVWLDPETNLTWVYVRTGWRDTKAPVRRYRLDDPKISEPVWSQSGTGQPQTAWFHVSGDGKLAADAFPWPQCGLADMNTKTFQVMGKGCWPGVAPDASHRYFYFIGQHTAVQFFDTPSASPRTVNLATVPGWTGRKVYHPRWTNDVRFITLTAPQWMPETELYIGRFDAKFTQIESWFRVTYNQQADFYGDAWFASASRHNQSAPGPELLNAKPTPTIAAAPSSSEGLVFVWENERSQNAIIDKVGQLQRTWTARYEGHTRPNRFNAAQIKQGSLVPDEDAGRIVSAEFAKTGEFTLLLDATPDSLLQDAEGTVMNLHEADGTPLLQVTQKDGKLRAMLRESDKSAPVSATLGEVKANQSTQIVLTYKGGALKTWRNGALLGEVKAAVNPGSWKSPTLLFGNDAAKRHPWSGALENLRIFSRELNAEEIAARYEKSSTAWQQRTPVPRVVVEAELLQASEPDEPETIAPYVRSLGENVYKVKKVLSGELADPSQNIIVLQWVVLGGKTLPSSSREEGTVHRLELEAADSHPELSGEHRSTDIFEPVLEVYYDVGL